MVGGVFAVRVDGVGDGGIVRRVDIPPGQDIVEDPFRTGRAVVGERSADD